MSPGQQKDLEGRSHSTVWVHQFCSSFPPLVARLHGQELTITANQTPSLILHTYKTIKAPTFTCNYRNYLADLAPAYATLENDAVDFEIVCSLHNPFHFSSLSTCTCENEAEQDILGVYKVGEHVDHILENFCTASIISLLHILKSIILLLM